MSTLNIRLLGHVLNNLRLFREAQSIGFDYIVNPETGELHKAFLGDFFGSHNLAFSNLGEFVGLSNFGTFPIHYFFDGTRLPIYDLITGDVLGSYVLNKCKHCFPHLQ